MMDYSVILEKLLAERCWVTFTKVNGDMRTMWCTLQTKYLPEQKDIEEVLNKPNFEEYHSRHWKNLPEDPKSIAVWDLEKSAWRSFRLDSMVKFEINSLNSNAKQSDFLWSKS